MMSDPLISSQLNDVLDSYGLSKTFIDNRRIVFNCLCDNVLDRNVNDGLGIIVGSKRDALCSFYDTESDIDMILIVPAVLFDEANMSSAKHFVSTLKDLESPVFILETGSHHGYKYLKCLANENEEYMFTKFRESTYLLNTIKQLLLPSHDDSEFEFEVHGPAVSGLIGDEDFNLQLDFVLGFHCPSLPKDFDEWCYRKRNYNWPPSWIIQATKKYGCFVVGVGHPNSDTQTMEWRLSLSKTEYLLTKSFNNVQMKCYALMKLVLKWIIQSELKEPLSSYHVKTVMFWMSEEQERQFWRPENLADCFISSLMKLKMFVENKSCPNYFITDVNLLEGKLNGEIYHRVLKVLHNIISEGPKVVYQCLPLNIRLNPSRCEHLNDSCYECLKKHLLDQRIEEMKSNEDKMESLTLSDTGDDIYRQSQFSLIDWYFVNEIRNNSMQHSYAFTAISVLEEMGLPNKRLYTLQKEYIAKLRDKRHVSRIKMATYFYYRRRLGYCIPILSLVIKSMESSYEFELCTADGASANDVAEIEGVECIYLAQNKKGFQVSEIVFNPCDKRLIPPDLQDEMGRSKTVNGIHYEGWVFVDSIVYAYYLLIVTLHDMRRYSGIVSLFRRFRKVCTQQPGTIRIFRKDLAERLYNHAFMLVWVATKGFTKLSE